MTYPDGFLAIQNAYWRLTPSDLQDFWYALVRSRYMRPSLFRQHISLLGQLELSTQAKRQLYTPHATVAVVEALVHEGLLPRAQATRIEERIIARFWGVERTSTDALHPHDVVTLATVGRPT